MSRSSLSRSSIPSEEDNSGFKGILPVVVSGLRDRNDETVEYYPWESYWVNRIETANYFPEVMTFDPGLNEEDLDEDILSPEWFDQAAEALLEAIDEKRKCSTEYQEAQIIFFGEAMGGFVLKKALILATTNSKYTTIARDTCACILMGVPHRIPPSSLWPKLLMGLILPFWNTLPASFWSSTAALSPYLEQMASDFIGVACRMSVITVYDSSSRNEIRDFEGIAYLLVAHERRIWYTSWSKHVAKFDSYDYRAVEEIFARLTKAVAVTPQYREYLHELCSRSPHTSLSEAGSVSEIEGAVLKFMGDEFEKDKPYTVLITGSHGTGKRRLSKRVFQSILSERDDSDLVAYFSFEVLDQRRRSVSTMLISVILQLLGCEPLLIPSVHQLISDGCEDTRWTEGNLWVQLRSIIHKSSSHHIYIVIDSLMQSETTDSVAFVRNFFNLRAAAPERLRLVCTGTSDMTSFELPAVVYINIDDQEEYKADLKSHHKLWTEKLILQNQKLKPLRDKVEGCLEKSTQYIHSNLLAHRISAMDTISCVTMMESHVLEKSLDALTLGYEATIADMIRAAPSWVTRAISCMMWVLRPLRSSELAVTFAIAGDAKFDKKEGVTEFDTRTLPLDIEGDLVQHLGPLICVQNEEVKIAHTYAQQELRLCLNRSGNRTDSYEVLLTTKLMNYLQLCLKRLDAGHVESSDDPSFGLFQYCLEYWHVHYRRVMDHIKTPKPADRVLTTLVISLIQDPVYLKHLQPGSDNNLTSGGSVQLDAPQLAARLGLSDIFSLVLEEYREPSSKNISNIAIAFHYACQYGHEKIVKMLLHRVEETVIQAELTKSCQRGQDTLVILLLDKYNEKRDPKDVPKHLLPVVCRMGHEKLARQLIKRGAKVNDATDGSAEYLLPLHEAVDQGHLELVKLLLENGGDPMLLYSDKSTPLLRSIERGYDSVSDCLLETGKLEDTPNAQGLTALHLAARKGDIELLNKIHDIVRWQGPLPKGSTLPLHEAAAHGHLEALRALLKWFPRSINEVNSDGKSALFLAISNDHEKVIRDLLQQKELNMEDESYDGSSLQKAIIRGNDNATKAVVERLPEGYFATHDETNPRSQSSPLTDAAQWNNPNIFKILLDAHASPTVTVDPSLEADDEVFGENLGGQWNSAHVAAYHNSKEVMELLISNHTEIVEKATDTGFTPLHLAAVKDHVNIVETFLPGSKSDAKVVIKEDTLRFPVKKSQSSRAVRSAQDGEFGLMDEQTTTGSATPSVTGKRSQRVFLDARTEQGRTALHISVLRGNLNLVKMLVKSGSDVELQDNEHRTILHFAASVSNCTTELLQFIFQSLKGKQSLATIIDQPDDDDKTALQYAVEFSNQPAVDMLLDHDANINTQSSRGITPLYSAASSGRRAIVEKLLEYGASINAKSANLQGLTALHGAVSSGYEDIVELLLAAKAEVNAVDSRGDTPLHEAARRGHATIVEKLLGVGANFNIVNSRLMSPLQRSILNRWTETTKMLLDAGADPNIRDEDGDNALNAAIMVDNEVLVKELLNAGANYDFINEAGLTPLMFALRSSKDMLSLLINQKPDVLRCDATGITILHKVEDLARAGDITELLNYGKHALNTKDVEGQAPIHHAAKKRLVALLMQLQEYGALITLKDAQGRTAMHHATQSMDIDGFRSSFETFLTPSPKNEVNVPDNDGWTPLHWACKRSYRENVELLLDSCETDEVRREWALGGHRRWTALAVAEFHENDDVTQLLEEKLLLHVRSSGTTGSKIRTIPESDEDSERFKSRLIPAKPGQVNYGVKCDDCQYEDIRGPRFKCKQHLDFHLCFKCYWHHKETHYPIGHDFNQIGDSLDGNSPEFYEPPDPRDFEPPSSPVKQGLSRASTFEISEPASAESSKSNEAESVESPAKGSTAVRSRTHSGWYTRRTPRGPEGIERMYIDPDDQTS